MNWSAIDIGSTAVRTASGTADTVNFTAQPHAYLNLPDGDGSRKLVERFEMSPLAIDGELLVVGDDAVELARSLSRSTKACFGRGHPKSSSRLAHAATRRLVEMLLDAPGNKDASCVFAIPGTIDEASPADPLGDLELGGIVASLGYTPEPVGAPAAAALGAFGQEGSGLLIVIGLAFSHMAVVVEGECAAVLTTPRAGELIDREAADALGSSAERISLLRERGIDLSQPHLREEEAIAVYVRTTVAHLALAMKERTAMLRVGAEAAGGTMPVLLAGGFARTGGICDPVRRELSALADVVELAPPEVASEPELAVLKGCLLLSSARASGGAPSASAVDPEPMD